ncbi:MAG: flagellar biosynthesis protein FliQ [Deltaproteobacteria bacterium]|nr:flagellar biosynthesis protein FliQ [Deltaproteobacteria bacterium]
MENSYLVMISKQSLYLVLILSAPPVLVAMILGLMISLLQATTQVQEQTLTFVPKLVAVMVTLALTGPWAMLQLVSFTMTLLDQFPKYVR